MKQGVNKLDHNAAAIKRWRSRLKRAMSMLDKLERQRKRLEARNDLAIVPPGAKRPRGHALLSDLSSTLGPAIREAAEDQGFIQKAADDLAIPSFLQRKKLDPVAAEIVAEQAAIKKQKAQGRIAKMKAKQSGETKKMPLAGKAALEAIRNG